MSKLNKLKKNVILPLSHLCEDFANIFYLNFYEIYSIQQWYIEMWEHNKEINYVPIEHLCGYFEPKYSLLIKLFFDQSIILFIF